MNADRRLDEHALHAYVDGALTPEDRARVESELRANPDMARRAEEYRRQNELLRSGLDPMLNAAIPSELRARPTRAEANGWLRFGGFAASLLLAGMLGWLLRGEAPERPDFGARLARHAAVAHLVYAPEVLHPVEVGARQENHLVGWLSKRVGVPLHVPHLGNDGFQLVGGRLLPGDNRPAAQFMYQDSQGRRLTLYVAANTDASRETAFRYAEDDHVNTFYWIDGPLGYALSGEIDRGTLLQVAETVYRQLER